MSKLFFCFLIFFSIDMFKSTCDELAEWIRDKNNALSSDDYGKDLKGIQALQRKHAVSTEELENLLTIVGW